MASLATPIYRGVIGVRFIFLSLKAWLINMPVLSIIRFIPYLISKNLKIYCILLLILCSFGHVSNAQKIPETWEFPGKYHSLISFLADSLTDIHDVNIKVKEKSIGTTMAIRPSFFSLFKKPENRTYILCINSDEAFDGVLLEEVPPEARVGLMAHELMHVRDYNSRGFPGLIKRGWQYLSGRGKYRFEHEIDQMVIDEGFGFFLYYWNAYVIDKSNASDDYREFKKRIYMRPWSILTELNKMGEIELPE